MTPGTHAAQSLDGLSVDGPAHASATAASQLPPAFPGRAPWGTASKLRAWQQEALDAYLQSAFYDAG